MVRPLTVLHFQKDFCKCLVGICMIFYALIFALMSTRGLINEITLLIIVLTGSRPVPTVVVPALDFRSSVPDAFVPCFNP